MSKITESYHRPNDRPFTIWCRVCCKYKGTKPYLSDQKPPLQWPPQLLDSWNCGTCKVTGSMVYQYEILDPDTPKDWKPKCKNSSCDGTCDNVLCIPPDYQLQKIVTQTKIERVKYFPWYMIFLSICGILHLINAIVSYFLY